MVFVELCLYVFDFCIIVIIFILSLKLKLLKYIFKNKICFNILELYVLFNIGFVFIMDVYIVIYMFLILYVFC